MPARVRVVERVARRDRPDADGLAERLGRVHRGVREVPVGGGRVRLSTGVVARRAVGRYGRARDDEVAEPQIPLQSAARPDADKAAHAELDELLDDDARGRPAHAGGLHGYGLALELAGEAEQAALAVAPDRALEIGLRDVFRAERVARQEARLGVVAVLGADVDRHAR